MPARGQWEWERLEGKLGPPHTRSCYGFEVVKILKPLSQQAIQRMRVACRVIALHKWIGSEHGCEAMATLLAHRSHSAP